MAERVTQDSLSVNVTPTGKERVTQVSELVSVDESSKVRVTQDSLLVSVDESSKVRVTQDSLFVNVNEVGNVRVTQVAILINVKSPPVPIAEFQFQQPTHILQRKRNHGLYQQASTSIFPTAKTFPIVFVVT